MHLPRIERGRLDAQEGHTWGDSHQAFVAHDNLPFATSSIFAARVASSEQRLSDSAALQLKKGKPQIELSKSRCMPPLKLAFVGHA